MGFFRQKIFLRRDIFLVGYLLLWIFRILFSVFFSQGGFFARFNFILVWNFSNEGVSSEWDFLLLSFILMRIFWVELFPSKIFFWLISCGNFHLVEFFLGISRDFSLVLDKQYWFFDCIIFSELCFLILFQLGPETSIFPLIFFLVGFFRCNFSLWNLCWVGFLAAEIFWASFFSVCRLFWCVFLLVGYFSVEDQGYEFQYFFLNYNDFKVNFLPSPIFSWWIFSW